MDKRNQICGFDEQIEEECRYGCVQEIEADGEDGPIEVIECCQEDLHVVV